MEIRWEMGSVNQDYADLAFILEAREHKILLDVDSLLHPESIETGTQCPFCPDSDQADDIIRQHTTELVTTTHRHVWMGLYGGGLLIPPHSPVALYNEGRAILEHLYIGHALRKADPIIPHGHAPCGMAKLHGLSARECFSLLTEAKLTVLEFFRRRKANALNFYSTQQRMKVALGREPEPHEIALAAKMEPLEAQSILRVSRLLPLAEMAEMEEPTVLIHFHVDYGRLGGEEKKRTYFLDRHAWGNYEMRRNAQAFLSRAHDETQRLGTANT